MTCPVRLYNSLCNYRTPITGFYQSEDSLLQVEEVQGGGEAVRGGEGSVDAEGAGEW
jgi:hypothetical protein